MKEQSNWLLFILPFYKTDAQKTLDLKTSEECTNSNKNAKIGTHLLHGAIPRENT